MISNFHEKSEYYYDWADDNVYETTANGKSYRHDKNEGKHITGLDAKFCKEVTIFTKVTYHQVIMWHAFDEPMPNAKLPTVL